MLRKTMSALAVCVLSAVSVAGRVHADPTGGPKAMWDTVGAYSSNSYSLRCRGNETTAIQIAGDGDTDLDLYVYDSDGSLIARSEGWSDRETIYVTLWYAETLTVIVENRGPVYNRFLIEAW